MNNETHQFILFFSAILYHWKPYNKLLNIFTVAQMAHFLFPYHFTIPNSEFRITKFALRISEFELWSIYLMWASGNR